MSRKFNHIKINFVFLKSEADMQSVIDYHNLPQDKWSVDRLMGLKSIYTMCFIDSSTFEIFAWTQPEFGKRVLYDSEFENMLLNEHAYVPSKDPAGMSVDRLLEKISKGGIESLTKWERHFLDTEAKSF